MYFIIMVEFLDRNSEKVLVELLEKTPIILLEILLIMLGVIFRIFVYNSSVFHGNPLEITWSNFMILGSLWSITFLQLCIYYLPLRYSYN